MALVFFPISIPVAFMPDAFAQLDTGPIDGSEAKWTTILGRESYECPVLKGVIISDGRGVIYECVAERRGGVPVLLRKTVIPMGGDTVGDVAQMSDGELAVLTVDRLEEWATTPWQPADTADESLAAPPPVDKVRPAIKTIARIAKDATAVGASPRKLLKDRYFVSYPTVDRWLQQARAAGHLDATSGRPGRPRKNRVGDSK